MLYFLPKKIRESRRTARVGMLIIVTLSFGLTIPIAQGDSNRNPGETVADAAVPKNSAMDSIPDEPGLPRVLLIGDSISIGYTVRVRELLKGQANVHRIPANGGTSAAGVANVPHWIGEVSWDVIVFNFGIHDLRIWDKGKMATSKEAGLPATPLENYTQNLLRIIDTLRTTNAKLVFATTTPIPQAVENPKRFYADVAEYNAAATQIMRDNDIRICDLFSAVAGKETGLQKPHDVHFNKQGSDVLAEKVAKSVKEALAEK